MSEEQAVNLKEVVDTVAEIYRSAKIVGTVVVLGGSLGLVLALVAATPLLTMAEHEFISLACLSGVLIVVGCALYAYLAGLQYKTTIATQIGNREAFEASLKAQEKVQPNFLKDSGG